MWLQGAKASIVGRKAGGRNGLVAVAIDKDKGSQHALKWANENLLSRGRTVILIHVINKPSSAGGAGAGACNNFDVVNGVSKQSLDKATKELFLTFHCFCTRKDIHCFDVILEDTDVAKALTEYVAHAAIENLVLGASRHGFIKFKMIDIPASVSKSAPDFCTVHVISKTKIASVRNAFRQAPFTSPLLAQIQKNDDHRASEAATPPQVTPMRGPEKASPFRAAVDDTDLVRSPFSKARGYHSKMFGDPSEFDSDISFISSDRPSTDRLSIDRIPAGLSDGIDARRNSRLSTSSDSSYGSIRSGTTTKGSEMSSFTNFSSSSLESDDVESEMRRLKLELQKTMEMYSTACKEALTAKQKAFELHKWRVDEERRMEETRLTKDSARLMTEQESGKRSSFTDSKDKGHIMSSLQYRKYTIEEIEEATESFSESRKVGEGGYGPVFKCFLDHTPVAVKVLRPDAAQGRSQFQQEVEVLSCLRHPNMVLLLGACPEYGCLVYEYMANGSLEDRLFRRGNTRALSWPLRFRIAAEISTGLHFLHQKKPKPLVHRDFKPANILLDQNYVSKISDVGLARLVPPSVAEETQYHMTSTAGTFCYIDPEYQQTGMLGTKSDIYSLGVVLLQILTAKPAMGLTHYVSRAIEKGTFAELLDPAVPDWPVEEALQMAKLALQCAELRRKDRPDLGKVILPELDKLRDLGEENFIHFLVPAKFNQTSSSAPPDNKEVKSESEVLESNPSAAAEETAE